MTLWLQRADGSLGAPRNFPSLTGVADLVVADWNGDGRPELFPAQRRRTADRHHLARRHGALSFPNWSR